MKKENKKLKQEQDRQAEEKQFKKQGNICLVVILVSFVLMLVVGQANVGAAWIKPFYGVMIAVIAAAFFYSLRSVAKHLRNMRDRND